MKRKILVFVLPVAVITGFLILKMNIDFFLSLLPEGCGYYMLTGKQCVACGNTRSVLAMLSGDIISAIRFNPAPPFLTFSAILLYAEFAINTFAKKKIRIVPRAIWFWIAIILIFMGYYIIRNI